MEKLQDEIKTFIKKRQWEPYHAPKNLILSLISEIGELADIFRWLTPKQSEKIMEDKKVAPHIQDEVADIFFNLIVLARKLNLDLIKITREKMKKNGEKYPV